MEKVIDHQQDNDGDTSMPEETHDEVKDAYYNMEKESEDDKQNYQTDNGPYPWTDLWEIDHFSI